jgi:hypothetical protein
MEKDDQDNDKANNNKMETKQWNGVCLDDGTGRNAVYIDFETGKVNKYFKFHFSSSLKRITEISSATG